MATVIPFVSAELAMQQEVASSLPELLVAQHHLTPVMVGYHLFSFCACGHVQQVVDDYPQQCALEFLCSVRAAMTERQFLRDLTRTIEAGRRDEVKARSL